MDLTNDLERSCKRARVDDEHESRGSNNCPICLKGFSLAVNMPCNPNDAQVIQQCGHSYHQLCFIEFHNACPEGKLLQCCLCRHEITKNLRLEATPILDPIRVAIDTQHDEQEQITIADHLRQEATVDSTVDRDEHFDDEGSENDEGSEDEDTADADYDPPTSFDIPDPHTANRRSSRRNIATIAPVDQEIEPATEMELHEPDAVAPITKNEKSVNEIREKLRTYMEGRQPILIPRLGPFMNRVSSTVESADVLELIQDIQASVERLHSIVFYFIGHVLNNAKSHISPQQYKELWKQTCSYLAQRRKIKQKTVYKYCQYAALIDDYPILFLADCKYGQLTQIHHLVRDILMEEPIQEYNRIHGQVLKAQLQNLLQQN